MRPIERIDNFLRILGEEWKKAPDLRFTQFLYNHGLSDMNAQYNLEEPEVLHMLSPDTPERECKYWTSFGVDGRGPLKHTLIKDLEKEHIDTILKTQTHLSNETRQMFEEELIIKST